MNTKQKTYNNYKEWETAYIKEMLPFNDSVQAAVHNAKRIWEAFWAGVRDHNLPDCGIWLIDRYGRTPDGTKRR